MGGALTGETFLGGRMDFTQFIPPLIGGVMIGLSASFLLLFEGRIFGISGILAGVLEPKAGEMSWRVSVLLGLVVAGIVLALFYPSSLAFPAFDGVARYLVAGLLVGFGTQLGSGCTSGHGVCGISRFSLRSIVATITFILTGVFMVAALRAMGVPV